MTVTEQVEWLDFHRECVSEARCYLLGWLESVTLRISRVKRASDARELAREGYALASMTTVELLRWYAGHTCDSKVREHIRAWLETQP